MKRLSLCLCILMVSGGILHGRKEEPIVSASIAVPVYHFVVGQTYPISIDIHIREPYHINSNKPLDEFLIPTTVQLQPQAGMAFGKIGFPAATVKQLEISESPMAIYEGTIHIKTSVGVAADFQGKEVILDGVIGYQACDNRKCLAPAKATFRRIVLMSAETGSVVPPSPAEKPTQSAADQTVTPAPQSSNRNIQLPAGVNFADKGLLLTFLLVFLGGLALNLTPCVYPLIPITISYFGGQSEGKKGNVIIHSFLYVIGMAVTYSVLGVIAAFTGSLFGSALQYPPILIAIAIVMVLLALSMFDVYELRMPSFFNRVAGGSQKGFFGTFFMGLTVGIVAAPCIGPFVLGLLTYVGNKANVLLGFSLFFVLALGLGMPFLFLGIFSGSIGKLPRSGAWMVWARTNFGFFLIAMAIYFVRSLMPNSLYEYLGLAMTMLIAGIYMAWIEPTKSAGKSFGYVRNIVGVIFFLLALHFAVTGIQDYKSVDAINWTPYSDSKLAEAAASGRPVMIDFFTEWCVACKELDKKTFADADVIATAGSFIMLKADITSADDPRVKIMTEKYAIKGVPTLVFLSPDGREMPDLRVTGFEPRNEFLPKMNRALALSNKGN